MEVILLKAMALMASIGLMAGSGAGNAPAPVAPPDGATPPGVEDLEDASRTVMGACEYFQAGNSGQYQFRCGGIHFIFRGEEEDLSSLLALLPDKTPEEIAALLEGEDAPDGIKHANRYGPLSPGQLKKSDTTPDEEDEEAGVLEEDGGGKGKAQAPGQLKKNDPAPTGSGGNGNGNGNGGGKGGKK